MDQRVPTEALDEVVTLIHPNRPRLIIFYLELKIGALLFFSHLLP